MDLSGDGSRATGAGPGFDLDPERRARAWQALQEIVEGDLGPERQRWVGPEPVAPDEVRQCLEVYRFAVPVDLDRALRDVATLLRDWTVHTASPAYFGLFNPAPAFAGIMGETLAAAFNPQLAVWTHAPAAVEIEQHVLRFIGSALGWPDGALAGSFTSGGAEANHTAVLLALTRTFPAYADLGLRYLGGQPVMYASRESHLAWLKLAHSCGLGRDAVRLVPTTATGAMDTGVLPTMIAEDRAAGLLPFLVVATAGTTAAGAIDPLHAAADICSRERLYLHVDAAWAGAVALSDRLAPLLSGIERADSVTVDAHKWFSVPMGAGMFLCRHPEALHAAFRVDTGYMPAASPDAQDPYTHSMQWSRRFTGLKLFLTLATVGRDGYARQFEHDVDLGHYLRRRLAEYGWRIVNTTELPVVCFLPPTGHEHVPINDIAQRLTARRRAWISTAHIDGAPALRACITSYRTTESDIDTLIEELAHSLRATGGTDRPASRDASSPR